jgi:hypothetical protein
MLSHRDLVAAMSRTGMVTMAMRNIDLRNDQVLKLRLDLTRHTD